MSENKNSSCLETIVGMSCILIFVSGIGFALSRLGCTDDSGSESSPSSASTSTKLNAEIEFSETIFKITNRNYYDWESVSFDLNSRIAVHGYRFRTGLIKAGKSIYVSSQDFTDSDGTRFNPSLQKPINMFVEAQTSDGKSSCFREW